MILPLLLISLVVLIYFLPNPPYDRIDIIPKEDDNFKLYSILPKENMVGQAYMYSKKYDIAIDRIPENMTITCNNRGSFIIDIENKDNAVVKDIELLIENAENLIFEYPKEFIVPPLSIKQMTLFVDADCSNVPKSVSPAFKVKGTQLEFDFTIYVENRAE